MRNGIMKAKDIFLPLFAIFCLIFCYIYGFPDLPVSKAVETDSAFLTDSVFYLKNNLFAVLYFFFSVIFGFILLIFGKLTEKKIKSKRNSGHIGTDLSAFVFLSGLWVLTDSSALLIFSDRLYDIVFISFASFLLMPLPFLKCLKAIDPNKYLDIPDIILSVNTAVFFVFTLLKTDRNLFLISLSVHHLLILSVIVYYAFVYLKMWKTKGRAAKASIPVGFILFFAFAVIALAVFLSGLTKLYSAVLCIGFLVLSFSVMASLLSTTVRAYQDRIEVETYKKLAYTDSMSGIKNYNAFLRDRQNTANSDHLCYVVIDINRLKNINDSLGHNAGNAVIRKAADIIHDCFSDIGKCYRIGGDEFAVICTYSDEATVRDAVARLENSVPRDGSESCPPFSLSCGYAFREDPETDPEQIFDKADEAMYLQKRKKRDESTTPDMSDI